MSDLSLHRLEIDERPRSHMIIIAPARESVSHEIGRECVSYRGLKTDPFLLAGDMALDVDAAQGRMVFHVSCPRMEFAIPCAIAGATSRKLDKRAGAA